MKKIILSVMIFGMSFFLVSGAKAGVLQNMIGWLWGGSEDSTVAGVMGTVDTNETGLGWVSMNSLNCDIDGDGIMDKINAGLGSGDSTASADCPADGTVIPNYGVNMPAGDGKVDGYAWSSNVGFIDFNPQDHCTTGVADATHYKAANCNPPSGQSGVFRQNGNLNGWARFVDIAKATVFGNSGGWDGWIGFNSNPYNVTVLANGDLSGYAWSEMGAIAFSKAGLANPEVNIDALPYVYLEPGETFAANKKRTTLSWTTQGHNIQNCIRTCMIGGTSTPANCPEWFDDASLILNGSVSDVLVSHQSVDFILECIDENGLPGKDIQNITYGCSPGVCNAGTYTCKKHGGNFIMTLDGDNATCTAGCTADNDCTLKDTTTWKEVAP